MWSLFEKLGEPKNEKSVSEDGLRLTYYPSKKDAPGRYETFGSYNGFKGDVYEAIKELCEEEGCKCGKISEEEFEVYKTKSFHRKEHLITIDNLTHSEFLKFTVPEDKYAPVFDNMEEEKSLIDRIMRKVTIII